MNENKCQKCGGDMVLRKSAHGQFLGCNNFPTCNNTDKLPKEDEVEVVKMVEKEKQEVYDKHKADHYEEENYQVKSRQVRYWALSEARAYFGDRGSDEAIIKLAKEFEKYIRFGE